jgi:segregation and condensation protein B
MVADSRAADMDMRESLWFNGSMEGCDLEGSGAPPRLVEVIEALLFRGGAPLSLQDVRGALPGISLAEFRRCVWDLANRYRAQRRPYRVIWHGGEALLALAPAYRPGASKKSKPRGLTLGQLHKETLAIIAYRQPIDRSGIEAMLGSDVAAALRHLLRLQLIAAQATDGRDQFITTKKFLEVYGLDDLADLPVVEELKVDGGDS